MGEVSSVEEISGQGVRAEIDGKPILIGNGKFMNSSSIEYIPASGVGTAVYVAVDGNFVGSILISDAIKEGVKEAIAAIKSAGVVSCIMYYEIGRASCRERV